MQKEQYHEQATSFDARLEGAEQRQQEFEELIALKDSEENFRTLVNASGDIIFRITPQGILSFATPAVEEQLGYTQEDLQEKRINVAKFVAPEDFMRVMANIHKVIQGVSIHALECRLMHKDGRHSRWYSMNCYPMYSRARKFIGVGGIARDISSIKAFEQQIRKQNERLSALNELASIASQSLDLDAVLDRVLEKVLRLFSARVGSIFLLDPDTHQPALKSCQGLSDAAPDLTPPVIHELGLRIYAQLPAEAFKSGTPLIFDEFSQDAELAKIMAADLHCHTIASIPLHPKDVLLGLILIYGQEQRQFHADDLQLLKSIGNQVGMAIENIHLYQRERRDKQHLEELNTLKDEFVSIVSHDLRSPLTAILGTTEILLNDALMDPPFTAEQKEFVRNIEVMGEQQLQLVNDLLDLAKIESGRLELNLTRADLREVAQQCYKAFHILAQNKNITLNFSADANVPRTKFDVPKIQQVISNLVGNAIKFTEPGGSVTLCITSRKKFLTVSVTDTGIGIDPANLAGVFNKFQQGRERGTRGERGTGLGLSICKNLIALHQGEIWAESQLNAGSTFVFTLPIGETTILIIDDSLFIIKSLEKRILTHFHNVKVISAQDGPRGLEQVEKEFPAVILLDYMMPEMDGLIVYQELRKRYGAKVPPTIFLTAEVDLDVRRRIFELGATDYLQKPLDMKDLLPRLSRFI